MNQAIEQSHPSDQKTGRDFLRERAGTSKRIAWILDECIRVPGTNIRFGLDAILGLVPGAGDFTATLIGVLVLAEAGKRGIPFKLLFQMGGNMFVNAIGGFIPFFGDLFSVWFKSNKRNYQLLTDFLDGQEGKTTQNHWAPMIMALIIIGLIVLINLAVVVAFILVAMYVQKHWAELIAKPA